MKLTSPPERSAPRVDKLLYENKYQNRSGSSLLISIVIHLIYTDQIRNFKRTYKRNLLLPFFIALWYRISFSLYCYAISYGGGEKFFFKSRLLPDHPLFRYKSLIKIYICTNTHNLIASISRLRNPEQTNKISCLYCKILATVKSGQIPRNNFFFLNEPSSSNRN